MIYDTSRPTTSASAVIGSIVLFVPLKGLIDINQEKARLQKEVERLEKQLESMNNKLSNHAFITKADKDIVERIYQCDICGLCKNWCISDYDIPELIIAARADIVNSGKITTRFLEIYRNIKKTGNPYPMVTNNDELKMVIDKKKSKIGKRVETMYFINSTTFYHPEIVKAVIKILNYAEIDFTILYKENSHIELLYQLGFWKEAEKYPGCCSENKLT